MATPQRVSAGKVHRGGVGTAEHNADALAWLWPVAARRECGKGCGATRLGNDASDAPQHFLRTADGVVGDQDHAADKALRDRKASLADALGRK